jgi:hypothetical protein
MGQLLLLFFCFETKEPKVQGLLLLTDIFFIGNPFVTFFLSQGQLCSTQLSQLVGGVTKKDKAKDQPPFAPHLPSPNGGSHSFAKASRTFTHVF